MILDEDLMLNRVLDKYGEVMRTGMRPEILVRFDALPPESRRALIMKQINKIFEDDDYMVQDGLQREFFQDN